MILDALLKTKSRTVLVDVINKNGNHSIVLLPEEIPNLSQSGVVIFFFSLRVSCVGFRFADVAQYIEAI